MDGEVDGRLPSERVSSKGKERVEEEHARVLARRASVSKGLPNDTNAIAELDVQHRRPQPRRAVKRPRHTIGLHRCPWWIHT